MQLPQPLIVIAKWAWLGLVLACLFGFILNRRQVIVEDFARFNLSTLMGSSVLLLLGKLMLNVAMALGARRYNIKLSLAENFYIYNISQLPKYVPGSIWQFVSRIALLQSRLISRSAIRDSMISENVGVILIATVIGFVLAWLAEPDFVMKFVKIPELLPRSIRIPVFSIFSAACVVIVAGWLYPLRLRLRRWLQRLMPPPLALICIVLAWMAIGCSFLICLIPFLEHPAPWQAIIGSYCLAWVAGFLVPISPAGLGVREAVLTLALEPFLNTQTALVVVGVHRLLYVLVEVLLGIFAWIVGHLIRGSLLAPAASAQSNGPPPP